MSDCHIGKYLAKGMGKGMVPTSRTCTHTLWILVPKTPAGQPYLCYCLSRFDGDLVL